MEDKMVEAIGPKAIAAMNAIQAKQRSPLLEERNSTNDVGRLAILISELQRDVMEMGKHLGLIMQKTDSIDRGAGQRLAALEMGLKQLAEKVQTPEEMPAA